MPLRQILRRLLGRPADDEKNNRRFFDTVYRRNFWGGKASRSGAGSEGAFAEQKVALLSAIIEELGVTSQLDIGCGDFHWMRQVAPRLDRYVGVDLVEAMVERNAREHGSDRVRFLRADLSRPGPDRGRVAAAGPFDLVSALDVFGHLLNPEVDGLLEFIFTESGARLFLVTNRRDATSREYLQRAKTRHEGIDLTAHPLFVRHAPRCVRQVPALYPGDSFDLYALR
jgi:cyclopropane fatty-acyl-phospholipid synthase-like methyltransferase